MTHNYRVERIPAFLSYGKFTKTQPTVNLCWLCKGFDELKQYFEGEGYKPNSVTCNHHDNSQPRPIEELQAA